VDLDLELASFRSKMGGGKLVPEKSWWGKKLVHLEEYIPVLIKGLVRVSKFHEHLN